MADEHSEYRIFFGNAKEWYHGSPLRLEVLAEGSTITPIVELAEAFSHKPPNLNWDISDYGDERWITITHDGKQDGYLYRVVVEDPEADLYQHPTSVFAPGEEMLTRRPLRLEFIGELPQGVRENAHFAPRRDGLSVRPATLDDVPGIRDVHSDGGDPWADPTECAIWINHRLLRDFIVDVAVLDARVVGHAEWQVSDEPAPYGRHLYLSMLEIHPEFRGRGIGREMVNARAGMASSLRCSAVRTIPDENAKGFYAKLGFEVTGQVTHISASTREADLPEGWARCRAIPHSVVKKLPLRLGWYQACSEFMWEHYERPIAVAGGETRHPRARRTDGSAFVDVGWCGPGDSAGPAAWASPEVDPSELVQASFALASTLPATEVRFAADSDYAPEITGLIGGRMTGTDDIIARKCG